MRPAALLELSRSRRTHALPKPQCRLGLVDRVEMQAGRAAAQQSLAEAAYCFYTEIHQSLLVVLQVFETQLDPARQVGAASTAEAHRTGVIGNRHDAGHDGNFKARLLTARHKMKIGLGVVKELRQRSVRSGFYLAAEVLEVFVRALGLG